MQSFATVAFTLGIHIFQRRNVCSRHGKARGWKPGLRVLLVEGNQLNAEIAAELLKMSGLTVDCAWDGYNATRAIRSSARDYCKRVPIVAMTANAFAEDVQAAKTVGMNEHIAKPLELATLAAVLRRYLGGGDA